MQYRISRAQCLFTHSRPRARAHARRQERSMPMLTEYTSSSPRTGAHIAVAGKCAPPRNWRYFLRHDTKFLSDTYHYRGRNIFARGFTSFFIDDDMIYVHFAALIILDNTILCTIRCDDYLAALLAFRLHLPAAHNFLPVISKRIKCDYKMNGAQRQMLAPKCFCT